MYIIWFQVLPTLKTCQLVCLWPIYKSEIKCRLGAMYITTLSISSRYLQIIKKSKSITISSFMLLGCKLFMAGRCREYYCKVTNHTYYVFILYLLYQIVIMQLSPCGRCRWSFYFNSSEGYYLNVQSLEMRLCQPYPIAKE